MRMSNENRKTKRPRLMSAACVRVMAAIGRRHAVFRVGYRSETGGGKAYRCCKSRAG